MPMLAELAQQKYHRSDTKQRKVQAKEDRRRREEEEELRQKLEAAARKNESKKKKKKKKKSSTGGILRSDWISVVICGGVSCRDC